MFVSFDDFMYSPSLNFLLLLNIKLQKLKSFLSALSEYSLVRALQHLLDILFKSLNNL